MTANPILLQKKYSRVIECFAKLQGLSLDEALNFCCLFTVINPKHSIFERGAVSVYFSNVRAYEFVQGFHKLTQGMAWRGGRLRGW